MAAPESGATHLFFDGDLLAQAQPGQTVEIEECRGRERLF